MVRNARIKIKIGDQLRPYTDGHWVIFNSKGFPTGFMHVERKHLRKVDFAGNHEADDKAAFADYWSWIPDMTPLDAALAGYTIQLVADEALDELMKEHRGDGAASKKERQNDDEDQAA